MKEKVVISGGKLMGYWCALCLKLFLSTDIKILGEENIKFELDDSILISKLIDGQLKADKTITVSILPGINEGLEKDIFLNLLEKEIYNELNKLN